MLTGGCRIALLIGIEYGWETYPSTPLSSAVLFISHAVLIASVLLHVDWAKL